LIKRNNPKKRYEEEEVEVINSLAVKTPKWLDVDYTVD